MSKQSEGAKTPKYPGILEATDGTGAVVHSETNASEGAGAYPITPSTNMGEGWAVAQAAGKLNVNGRRLIFFEPEGEHAAAAVTAGMSMAGLRATNFSSGQGIVYMHESLYAATGKRLSYVLHVAARAITKQALNVHAGHDDYHAVDDTGFFQLFAKDVQEIGDFAIVAHRIAEQSLNPGLCAQDGFLTSHVIEVVRLPEPELISEFLGDPADIVDTPTPAQCLVFGEKRRRIPELFNVDYPAILGPIQNQESYAQGVAAQRPFYFDHIADLTDQAFGEYAALTGRAYARASGYLTEDAEYILAGQGSVVPSMEVVADHLRKQGLKVGVLNVAMFRPFPADLITRILSGAKAVLVLERTDQPLAVDPPLVREIRAAMTQGLENWKALHAKGSGAKQGTALPYPKLTPIDPASMPDFYSAGFGFGSRDLQPGDIVAAVNNMLPDGKHRRQFYLGIDFIRKGTKLPKLQIWQEQLLDAYPHLTELALESAGDLNLLPAGATSLRIHSVGGWGAITMGKNIAMTAFELFGMQVKANPKYGSEKKGQPTTFYAVLAHEPIKLNSELKSVTVVLAPDGNVFRHSNPLAGMAEGGVFVIQSSLSPEELWRSLPEDARRTIREKRIQVYMLDAFGIASSEASDPELRYRMQGVAFMGAFFKCAPLAKDEGMEEVGLFEGITKQITDKFGKLGQRVVDDNMRVIRRGYDEVKLVPTDIEVGADEAKGAPGSYIPSLLDTPNAEPGIGNQGRFFEQVCGLCAIGQDGIADPFAALSAIPAATSTVRDMTNIRFEVPDFVAEKCTGCSQCWVQCPDSAIPGLVVTVEDLFDTAIRTSANGKPNDRVNQISKHLARESRKILKGVPFNTFGDVASAAYKNVVAKLGWDADRRAQLDEEWARVFPVLAEFPLAKTTPFFDMPESKTKDAGALLAITIAPEACKGCGVCVAVCPEHALVTVQQDEAIVDRLRRNWKFWEQLPDTPDRYINVRDLDEGIGVLSSLLLKKDNYRSMVGGDGACMGCGEKTAMHLITSTIEALMQPRVGKLLARIDELVAALDKQEREILGSAVDVKAAAASQGDVGVKLSAEDQARLRLLQKAKEELEHLKWLYVEGPSGRGRVPLGMTNATGCSSVWGSTYPYNPYPYPWVNHLFQDAPSVAIGVFEGHMRKMGDHFLSLRRAEQLVAGTYEEAAFRKVAEEFDWQKFTDDEFHLCPPIMAVGGDGAMMDIGFQNLSRLMASGKPIRVLVLDTQVYSNTGGQACTSGFTGQVADMSAWGKARHGKTEVRKELAFIAMAHRGVFVHQTSQASASHLIQGVIKGLNARRPSLFIVYTPCPVEHGLADDWAPQAAKLALESRAFPFVTYDPDGGPDITDCLSLDGNPQVEEAWPTYQLKYVDDEGKEASMDLPLTTADWALTEVRFRKNFSAIKRDAWNDDQLAFHEFMALSPADREGKVPFVWALAPDRTLKRVHVSNEMVVLAEDRLRFWHQLKEMAGLDVPAMVRDALVGEMESEYEGKLAALKQEFEAQLADLKATYPKAIARRMAEGLLRLGDGDMTVSDLLTRAEATPGLTPIGPMGGLDFGGGGVAAPAARAKTAAPAAAAVPAATAAAPAAVAEEEEGMRMEAYIESARCTSCNECTNLNSRMFSYNESKQAYVKDVHAGTFAQLVQAAEKCPAGIIHPGDPVNPKEKDLAKWIKRAEPFN
ncbi:MAG TPA: 2-oxoacid:acceptor oxidoreductase family protein [Longimicrobiales bacterium]|nr:2-oxoacid:acceptor oxidoreductase family protein [Longimicrobiales bacterium]